MSSTRRGRLRLFARRYRIAEDPADDLRVLLTGGT